MNLPSGQGRPALAVTSWGAARSVTGSMHLVQACHLNVLLDCGLERAHHALRRHDRFPFEPHSLDAVVLSHAHMDHCGNLPNLVGRGFAGPIYCTPATRDLIALMLHSSARVQEEEAFVKGVIAGVPEEAPVSQRRQVDQVLRQCVPVAYEQPFEIGPGVVGRLVNAGHVLGSAMVHLMVASGGHPLSLTFTGDLGRRGAPLLPDPSPVPAAEIVLSESTYGGRYLEPIGAAIDSLEDIVRRTVERDGKVLIPAFSLGRTQVLTALLAQAIQAGRLPQVPVFVDGPLAADIAAVYRHHPDALDEASAGRARAGQSFLDGPTVRYVRSHEESRALTQLLAPAVILAPGGMCEGGRILQHLKHHVDDPRCSIVLVSYQAPHTPGRRLLERGPTVRIHGRKWNKWAEVFYLAGFSGHADHNDLVAYLGPLAGRAGKLCLIHGEEEQAQALARNLRERGFAGVLLPERGETIAVAG
jgi:metallo-beta-lactamase family protein